MTTVKEIEDELRGFISWLHQFKDEVEKTALKRDETIELLIKKLKQLVDQVGEITLVGTQNTKN